MDRLQAERFAGLSGQYDRYRPSTPIEKLCRMLQVYRPLREITVVDVGCGTGLSTIPWAQHAKQVFGVDPNTEMISVAKSKLGALSTTNVTFIDGDSRAIKVADSQVDVVTCSQSFHWMEPSASLREFHRILKPGGLLAIYDYDWPPVVGASLEKQYWRIMEASAEVLRRNQADAKQWPKTGHLQSIRESGLFTFQKEICFDEPLILDSDLYIGMIESQGAVRQATNWPDERLAATLADAKREILAEMAHETRRAMLVYRLRLAIK
jgi:ubiquinone/menaquinone biosynthesis C-methylase UbiE